MDIAFRLDLPHGRCVGVAIPGEADTTSLPEDERAAAESVGAARRAGWVAGRLALRAALADLGIGAGALLTSERGAPVLPAGALGSISHKEELAVALASARPPGEVAIGVDLELDAPLRVDISRRVLTPAEQENLDGLDPGPRNRLVLLHVSAKEAIYKALDPFVARYVSFQEAELELNPDGTARATLTLTRGEGPFSVEVYWRDLAPTFLLTTARVERLG